MKKTGQTKGRSFSSSKIVIASHNQGKVREVKELLLPYVSNVYSAKDLSLPEPEETGSTFQENSELKAKKATEKSGLPALADDSGLVVPSLGGDPGIYSSRWSGPNKDFDVAMKKIEARLKGIKDRSAFFICALSLTWADGHVETVEVAIKGNLIWPPKGNKGFGYDPIFVPNGYKSSFGEMEPEEKHKISHRARAFNELISNYFCKKSKK